MVKTFFIGHAIILSGGEAMDTILIGKFLAALRKERGLTQEELGEKIGVTNKTISRWENGNYMPPVEALLALSELYEISINEILTGRRLSMEDYKESAEKNIQATLEKNNRYLRNLILGILVIATFVLTIFTNLELFIFGGTPDTVLPYIASLLHMISWVLFLVFYKSSRNSIIRAVSFYWGVFSAVNLIVVLTELIAPNKDMGLLLVGLFMFPLTPFAVIDFELPFNFLTYFIIGMILFVWSFLRVILNRKRK